MAERRLGLRGICACLPAALALALAACGREAAPPADPLIYEIVGTGGVVKGWVFGTIHALPDGTHWRTPPIERAIDRADVLMVEIADLEERARIASIFEELAATPGLPPLSRRIDPGLRPELAELMSDAGLSDTDTARIETWAAALMLARAVSDSNAQNGVDLAVISDFEGREVIELEGARSQLAIFDRLAEADQRDLLREVVAGASEIGADPAALREAWLAGDEAALIEASTTGLLDHEELRRALLIERNRKWLGPVLEQLARGGCPLVAVGAAHVVGPSGLAAMIERNGFRVRPVHESESGNRNACSIE